MTDRSRGMVAVLVLAWAASAPAADLPAQAVSGYIDALRSGDWATARTAWRSADLARAGRLGIAYQGVPLKIDGDSAIGALAVDHGLDGVQVDASGRHPLGELLPPPPELAAVQVHGQDRSHTYLLAVDAGPWRLAAPVGVVLEECARRDGAVAIGRYVRAVTGPGMGGCVPALAALDSFVADTLERLAVPAERRRLLEREKIDYLYVPPVWVEMLAGAPTVGVANLQLDVVVTHHPCHLHELAHILVNFWLQDLPLYTQPLLQEGLAVHLGGRWGRSPQFMGQVGRMFLESGFLPAEGLLTRSGFYDVGADLAYAAAGVVAGWVLDASGPEALKETYSGLSGTLSVVNGQTADQVAATLAAALELADTHPGGFADALAVHVASLPGNPLHPAPADAVSGPPLRRFSDDGLVLELRQEQDAWVVVVTGAAGTEPAGALLVIGPGSTVPSALHAEHFPAGGAPAAVAALRFNAEEAGWYDYGRDLLLAKHIASFWPEPPAYDPDTRTLRLAWPRALLPWDLAGGDMVLRAGD